MRRGGGGGGRQSDCTAAGRAETAGGGVSQRGSRGLSAGGRKWRRQKSGGGGPGRGWRSAAVGRGREGRAAGCAAAEGRSAVAGGRRRRQAVGHRTAPRTRLRRGRGSASPPRGSWRAGAGRAAPVRAGAGGNRWHGCCGRWSGGERRRWPRAGAGGEDGTVGGEVFDGEIAGAGASAERFWAWRRWAAARAGLLWRLELG